MELESALILANGCSFCIIDNITIRYKGEREDTSVGKYEMYEVIRVKKGWLYDKWRNNIRRL